MAKPAQKTPSIDIGIEPEPLPIGMRSRTSAYPWDKIAEPKTVNGQMLCSYFDVKGVDKEKFSQSVYQRNAVMKARDLDTRFRCVAKDYADGSKGVRVYRIA